MVYLLFKLVIMEVIAGSVLGVVVAGTVVVGVCAICRSHCTQCFFVFCFSLLLFLSLSGLQGSFTLKKNLAPWQKCGAPGSQEYSLIWLI